MMTPVCPRLLNMINVFVLLRFWDRAPEDLSAIEVIYYIIMLLYYSFSISLTAQMDYITYAVLLALGFDFD